MKNKILLAIASVILATLVWFVSSMAETKSPIEDKNSIEEWEEIETAGELSWEYDNSNDQLQHFMEEEIAAIPFDFDDMSQKMDWFKAYKEIIAKYPQELHSPTIYDTYCEDDLDLLFRIVQSETGDEYAFREKANVASVIFNRSNTRNQTIREVLTAKNQFTPYSTGSYKKVTVDEKTILACEYVFIFGDTTNGCVSFRSHRSCPKTWYSWTRQFADDAHCFYK